MTALSEDCVRTSEFYEALLELCASISSGLLAPPNSAGQNAKIPTLYCNDHTLILNTVSQWSYLILCFNYSLSILSRDTATPLGFK
jgi:hypothetical protein